MRRFAAELLLVLLIPFGSSLRAQHVPSFSAGFVAAVPQGPFARNVSHVGFGVGGFLGDQLPDLPITLALDGAIILYGLDARDWPFELALGEPVDAFTTRGIGMAHFVVRLQDTSQRISPYADLLVGAKYLFTETRVDGGEWGYDGDPLRHTLPFDDVALSYGMGGGIRLEMLTRPITEDGAQARITLHAGIRYLFGGPAEYLTRDSMTAEDGELVYEVRRSRTDLIVPQFGFTVSAW